MTPRELELRDEVLQLLYWRQGEGLGDEARLADVTIFLPGAEAELPPVLFAMVRDGLCEAGSKDATYRLSAVGKKEAGRRFAEAFTAEERGSQGHGSCGPDCEDCLTQGPENCSAHQSHEGHSHGSANEPHE